MQEQGWNQFKIILAKNETYNNQKYCKTVVDNNLVVFVMFVLVRYKKSASTKEKLQVFQP